ncbi:MAG: hypothetical protein KDA85_18850 [Planctomycetaceae bacterium]|nr:hypothetical protein [Planctomycetaceae bacterium]
MDGDTFSLPDDAIAYWRLAGDESLRPVRPIKGVECRIGSGADCDLRLAGDGLPGLHSMLRIKDGVARLTCCAAEPELVVNGTAVRECRLYDGDLVEIGTQRMLFRSASGEERISLCESDFAVGDSGATSEDVARDAVELVDRIEHELALITELERTTAQSLQELLTSASSLAASEVLGNHVGASVASHEASGLREQLALQSAQLQTMSEIVEQLVQQQQLTARALQVLGERLETLQSTVPASNPPHSQRRASA